MIKEILKKQRPDGTIFLEPDMNFRTPELKDFPVKNHFTTKHGYYFDDSIFEVTENIDGTIKINFKSFRIIEKNKYVRFINVLGQLHRTDGPAAELSNGTKYWFQNGLRHRTDGPAIECYDGTKHWYQNDKSHRTNDPAVEIVNGNKRWFLRGKEIKKYLNIFK